MMITEKPWGKEELLELNNKYMVKKLTMYKGKRCSLQYHKLKVETIYVLDGKLKIYIGLSKDGLTSDVFEEGCSITIPEKVMHRMEAIEDSTYLEASTPDIDDVIRIEDDYNRS